MDIPPEIMTEILLRLPTGSLGRFKCVSKSWLSQISEPQFIKRHLNTVILTRLVYTACNSSVYTLPFSQLLPDKTPELSLLFSPKELFFLFHGSCNGLVLGVVYVHTQLVIFNPTTKEKILIPRECNDLFLYGYATYRRGFGYDSSTDDYKVVTLSYSSICKSNYVYVYSLRNNTWRRVKDDFLQGYSLENEWSAVFVNGFLHWIVKKGSDLLPVIVAFSLEDETFSEVPFPSLGNDVACKLFVAGEKLGAFLGDKVCVMNEYGVRESWENIVLHGLEVCKKMNEYGVRDWWTVSIGYGYKIRIVETTIFYEDGEIVLVNWDKMWVYDAEGKSCHKYIFTSKDIIKYFCGIYVESLVSPKFGLTNQKSACFNEGSRVELKELQHQLTYKDALLKTMNLTIR